MSRKILSRIMLGVALLGPALPAPAGDVETLVGLTELIERIGLETTPTGLDVLVGQVEARDGQGDYGPNQGQVNFEGKTFIEMDGPTSTSAHAQTVGANFYGLFTSIAPAISTIHLYAADGWFAGTYLRATSAPTTPPAPPPADLRIFNNSWAGNGPVDLMQATLRRADFAVVRDDVIMANGVPNDAPNVPLMSHTYNGISVGRMDRGHFWDEAGTLPQYDGPGRMKPEIVAPGDFTSFATPVVAAASALMIETARGLAEPEAERSEVIKAVLLAGATHRQGWTNNPAVSGPDRGVADRPLDVIYGVDLLNVNTGHLILTGGAFAESPVPPFGASIEHAGWSLPAIGLDQSAYYRFSLAQTADAVSILATWHRDVELQFASWSVADIDLILWRVETGNELLTLVGDAGLPHFGGGNVVSQSLVDNVEHLYVTGLQPGDYVLEVRRQDSIQANPEWDVAVAWLLPEPPPGAPGDVNGDGVVDVLDLIAVILAWGPCAACPEDVNGDGVVDVLDLIDVVVNWG